MILASTPQKEGLFTDQLFRFPANVLLHWPNKTLCFFYIYSSSLIVVFYNNIWRWTWRCCMVVVVCLACHVLCHVHAIIIIFFLFFFCKILCSFLIIINNKKYVVVGASCVMVISSSLTFRRSGGSFLKHDEELVYWLYWRKAKYFSFLFSW